MSRVLLAMSCLVWGGGCSAEQSPPQRALGDYPAISQFIELGDAGGLIDSSETVTIFAPVDDVMGEVTQEDAESFVLGYLATESLSSSALLGRVGSPLVMRSGRQLMIGRDGNFITLTTESGAKAKLIAVDIEVEGKVVHFIDEILE